MRSMTGYGLGSASFQNGIWQVEIHSVNKKNLDIHVLLPKKFLCFDSLIRKWIASSSQRGNITLRINFDSSVEVKIEEHLYRLKNTQAVLEKIATQLGYPSDSIPFPFLYEQAFGVENLVEIQTSEMLDQLECAFRIAVTQWIEIKEKEGLFLARIFLGHIEKIEYYLVSIDLHAEEAVSKRREKLLQKMEEFKTISSEDKERVLREVFLYAEKVDVSEEINRLKSHLHQLKTAIHSNLFPIGKLGEFILQEMWREITTLSSKIDEETLLSVILSIKNEIDKMKEQIQNVE